MIRRYQENLISNIVIRINNFKWSILKAFCWRLSKTWICFKVGKGRNRITNKLCIKTNINHYWQIVVVVYYAETGTSSEIDKNVWEVLSIKFCFPWIQKLKFVQFQWFRNLSESIQLLHNLILRVQKDNTGGRGWNILSETE